MALQTPMKSKVFEPAVVRIMGEAFDGAYRDARALAAFERDSDRLRDVMAHRILQMVQLGERDIGTLRTDALRHAERYCAGQE